MESDVSQKSFPPQNISEPYAPDTVLVAGDVSVNRINPGPALVELLKFIVEKRQINKQL